MKEKELSSFYRCVLLILFKKKEESIAHVLMRIKFGFRTSGE